MNYHNGLAPGEKWFFLLAMVAVIGAFALGINIKDAKWLNGEIASATAHEMNVATNIEQKKAELDLLVLQTQTEIQVAEMKRQAEYEAARQQQELTAATTAAMQKANFQAGLYSTLNFGLMAVIAACCIALTIIGIYAGVGLYKILNAKAQAIHSQTVVVRKRQPSPAVQEARQREREDRERKLQRIDNRINQLVPDSELIWTAAGDNSENLNPEDYPWAA